jgi:hypothetical protein
MFMMKVLTHIVEDILKNSVVVLALHKNSSVNDAFKERHVLNL